jgi:MFS family permease
MDNSTNNIGNKGNIENTGNTKKSYYVSFIKKLLFSITFFSTCLYLIMHNFKSSNIPLVITQTKIIFYLLLGILFYFISDILRTQEDFSKKIVGIILFCIFISYISNYFLEKYFKSEYYYKFLIVLGIIIGTLLFSLILVYLIINKPDYDYFDINNVFDECFKKNLYYFIFYFILLIIYSIILFVFSYPSSKNQILQPALLGLLLMLFVFSFIIYICKNIGLINGYQYLDTFIVLLSIFIICGYLYFYLLLSSISTICTDNNKKEESIKNSDEAERVVNIMLISLLGVLWIGDSKIWNQFEYIVFIIITVVTCAGLFYYSTKYPSTGIISLWLFIEWIMLLFKNGNNAKNSFEGVFRKKIYRKHYE